MQISPFCFLFFTTFFFLQSFFFITSGSDLRLNQIQSVGTHNSYHISPSPGLIEWGYTHPDFITQLSQQFVRHFELDWQYLNGEFVMSHVPIYDEGSNCGRTIQECCQKIKDWSDSFPLHAPIWIGIQTLNRSSPGLSFSQWSELENILTNTFGASNIVKPSHIKGTYPKIMEAINATGWPKIDDLRGKVLFYAASTNLRGYLTNRNDPLIFETAEFQDRHTRDVAVLINLEVGNEEIETSIAEGFIVRLDPDGEYLEGRTDIPESEERRAFFAVMDRNHDQIVTLSEIQLFLSAARLTVSAANLNLFLTTCGDGSNILNEDQMECFITQCETVRVMRTARVTKEQAIARRDTVLAEGVQLISTDYQVRTVVDGYELKLSNGKPYRCRQEFQYEGCDDDIETCVPAYSNGEPVCLYCSSDNIKYENGIPKCLYCDPSKIFWDLGKPVCMPCEPSEVYYSNGRPVCIPCPQPVVYNLGEPVCIPCEDPLVWVNGVPTCLPCNTDLEWNEGVPSCPSDLSKGNSNHQNSNSNASNLNPLLILSTIFQIIFFVFFL